RRVGRVLSHPHVEPRAGTKGEAARLIVELMRRYAQIEENAVERVAGERRQLVDRGKIRLERREPARTSKVGEACGCGSERVGIAIHTDHGLDAGLEQ